MLASDRYVLPLCPETRPLHLRKAMVAELFVSVAYLC
jgi:hypothetical protein